MSKGSAHESLKALDAALARGIADAKAGRLEPADEVFDRLEAKYRAMVASRAGKGSEQDEDARK
jgi:predicted transcriptional regulator